MPVCSRSGSARALRRCLLATCSGSERDRSGLMFPWMLMSPRTSVAAVIGTLRSSGERRDEERHADLGFDPVVEQIDHFNVKVSRIHLAANAELRLARQR